jgi:uncharacterized protein YdhG (YjbR/CyaY superfamily)
MPMAKKAPTKKLTDAEQVAIYMGALEHPLKAEIEALRTIIKKSNAKLSERIKWNAPSYYYLQDIVTFGPKREEGVLLVFHHPFIVHIKSHILEGDYKDRRLAWFKNMAEVKKHKSEVQRIINEIIAEIDRQAN